MGPEASAGLGAATGATLGVIGAVDTNKKIKRQQDSTVQAGAIQGDQAAAALSLEELKAARENRRTIGSLRVAASQAGSSDVGSYAALINEATINAAENDAVGVGNTGRGLLNLDTSVRAKLDALQSQKEDPLMAGIMGAVGGAQTGLSLDSAMTGPPVSEEELNAKDAARRKAQSVPKRRK
jgi:hypothetical protein